MRKFPVFLSASSLTKPEAEVGGVGEFVKVVLILKKHQDAHHDIKFASWAVGKEMRVIPSGNEEAEAEVRGVFHSPIAGEKLILCRGGLPTWIRRAEKTASMPRA